MELLGPGMWGLFVLVDLLPSSARCHICSPDVCVSQPGIPKTRTVLGGWSPGQSEQEGILEYLILP